MCENPSNLLTPLQISENPDFVGREFEKGRLKEFTSARGAKILTVYGRRRIGKTELLEQYFRNRNILKFEGLEDASIPKQKESFIKVLAGYCTPEGGDCISKMSSDSSWSDILISLANLTHIGKWTVYFEELQWLAKGDDPEASSLFISELKYVWDNHFRRNDNLLLILCGSSTSFMLEKVVKSRALYGRAMTELPLAPFSIKDTREFLGGQLSQQSLLDVYLTVGGIPEYLKRFKNIGSYFETLAAQSFLPGGAFATEFDRVFISSLGKNEDYKKIVLFLSQHRFLSMEQLATLLGRKKGGWLTNLLEDLEQCDFIESYWRFDANSDSKLLRYTIKDYFLQFYSRFIYPKRKEIKEGRFKNDSSHALDLRNYRQWLGYAFERFVRHNQLSIAKALGFSGIQYDYGPFFKRSDVNSKDGFQIDLVFDRSDGVLILCEIKYTASPVGVEVIEETEAKMVRLQSYSKKLIQPVLITKSGAAKSLIDAAYFQHVLGTEMFFNGG